MNRHLISISLLLSLGIVLAACGQVAPITSVPGSAGFDATGSPVEAIATTGGPSGSIGVPPAEDPSNPSETAMNAAIAYAKSTLHASHPHATVAETGLLNPSDPSSTIWIVELAGDTFQLPSCPPGTPQTSYARSCGSGTQAQLRLRLDDDSVVDVELYSISATPIAQSHITLPPGAKLPTREAAIEAALDGAPIDNNSPHVVSVDLILAGQDSRLENLPPDTPIWRISLDHGQFGFSCPPEVAARTGCDSVSTTMWIEAITGMLRAQSYPMATPTP